MSRSLPALLAFIVLTVGLLACGGGGGGSRTAGSSSTPAPPSQQPQTSGEKSIEDFGREATGSDRAALLASFHTYLEAIAAHDYATACPHLIASVQTSLKKLLPKSLKPKGCPAALPRLLAPTAAPISRAQAKGTITKVRIEGDQAFVVFHAPGASLYQMPMRLEGGAWKVGLLAASMLVPSRVTLGE